MKKKTIAQMLAEKNMCMGTWARNKGFSEKDRELLNKLSRGVTNGSRAGSRTREILELLRKDGLVA